MKKRIAIFFGLRKNSSAVFNENNLLITSLGRKRALNVLLHTALFFHSIDCFSPNTFFQSLYQTHVCLSMSGKEKENKGSFLMAIDPVEAIVCDFDSVLCGRRYCCAPHPLLPAFDSVLGVALGATDRDRSTDIGCCPLCRIEPLIWSEPGWRCRKRREGWKLLNWWRKKERKQDKASLPSGIVVPSGAERKTKEKDNFIWKVNEEVNEK